MAKTIGLTYDDLVRMFPDEDKAPRELVGGELFVSPPPFIRHQRVVGEIFGLLWLHAKEHGGQVFVAPTGIFFTDRDFVEPDVVFVLPEHAERVEEPFVRGAPDLVVEVSSPSTRRRDRGVKRDLYERHGVAEYWFVDLEADRIEVHRRQGNRFAEPVVLRPGDVLRSSLLPGLEAPVEDLLARG